MGGLLGAHAVSVQRCGQDIDRRAAGRETGSGQFRCLPGKDNGVGCILPGTDGLIGRFGNVGGSNAHAAGRVQDLLLQLIYRYDACVGNGVDLGKRCLESSADIDRRSHQLGHFTPGGLDKV